MRFLSSREEDDLLLRDTGHRLDRSALQRADVVADLAETVGKRGDVRAAQLGVDVDLYDARGDRVAEVGIREPGSAVQDQRSRARGGDVAQAGEVQPHRLGREAVDVADG